MGINDFSLKAICILLGALTITVASAEPPIDYEEREEGWFWYKDPLRIVIRAEDEQEPVESSVSPRPPQSIEKPPVATSVDEGPEPLSVAWLQEKLPETIELAIDDPGEDLVNVRAALYLQRLAFDKSEQFAKNWQQVALSDPLLDENNRFPTATFGRRTRRLRDEEEQNRRLEWLSENVGFFYFHDQNCDYCIQQLPVLEQLKSDYGFEIYGISVDGKELDSDNIPSYPDDGHAVKFRVQTVPAVVMVWPPDNAAIISQSIIARDQFVTRAVNVSQMHDVLTEEVDRSLGITPESYVGLKEVSEDFDEDDPASWINHIREEAGYAPLDME